MNIAKKLIDEACCVAVSACLLGENCKYNGGNNLNKKLITLLLGKEVIPVCPEIMGGLGTPRNPCEIKNGCVINTRGEDVTLLFNVGAECAFKKIVESKADVVILQSRSPSCGVNEVYDGNFNGSLIQGKGVFAQLLERYGINTIDIEDL